jgi:hypothetical protein
MIPPVHPIEAESYRILAGRVDLDRWPPLSRSVVARVIHASADVGYADTLVLDEASCAAGVVALVAGAPVVADVDMVAVATRRAGTVSLLAEGRARAVRDRVREPALTVSAAAEPISVISGTARKGITNTDFAKDQTDAVPDAKAAAAAGVAAGVRLPRPAARLSNGPCRVRGARDPDPVASWRAVRAGAGGIRRKSDAHLESLRDKWALTPVRRRTT